MSNGYNPRSLAYLGDAVFELWVRRFAIERIQNAQLCHEYVTKHVNAEFQCQLLDHIETDLSDEEKEIIREGRNAPLSTGRRHNQQVHRRASGFETLIGHLHLHNPDRLRALLDQMTPLLSPTP